MVVGGGVCDGLSSLGGLVFTAAGVIVVICGGRSERDWGAAWAFLTCLLLSWIPTMRVLMAHDWSSTTFRSAMKAMSTCLRRDMRRLQRYG